MSDPAGNDPDLDLVLRAYDAYARGDIAAAVADMHPEVEWIEPDEFPNGGRRHIVYLHAYADPADVPG